MSANKASVFQQVSQEHLSIGPLLVNRAIRLNRLLGLSAETKPRLPGLAYRPRALTQRQRVNSVRGALINRHLPVELPFS